MAQMTPLGMGLVGCGSVATNMHLNGWTRFPDKARLLAVFDVSSERANRMAALVQDAYRARAFEYSHEAACNAYGLHDRAREEEYLRRAASARQAAEQPAVFVDLDQLLADPRIEAVIVATPHHLHAPISAAALAAGKHVISEGPMAINLEQADAVLAAHEASGRAISRSLAEKQPVQLPLQPNDPFYGPVEGYD